VTEHSLTPTRELPKSAGFELRSPYETTVPDRGKELIKTDLQMKLTKGCCSRIESRADLALFHYLERGAGVMDETI
jgi:dUTP pyrophosphatase